MDPQSRSSTLSTGDRWRGARWRGAVLNYALQRLLIGRRHDKISNIALLLILLSWGNLFYSAGWRYLRQVAKSVLLRDGAVLECGSGATTLIVGALTTNQGRRVQVLEHNLAWFEHINGMLQRVGIDHVELVYAPLREFDGYSWYGPPADFSFAENIDLVICDGPPSGTQGGRYGMLPLLKPHLSSRATILLDDTHRRGERLILNRWRQLARFDTRRSRGLISESTEITLG